MQVRFGNRGSDQVRATSSNTFLAPSYRSVCCVVGDDDMYCAFVRTKGARSVSSGKSGRRAGCASIGVSVHVVSFLQSVEYLRLLIQRTDHWRCDLKHRIQIDVAQSNLSMSLRWSRSDSRLACLQDECSVFGSRGNQCGSKHDVSDCTWRVCRINTSDTHTHTRYT